MEGWYLEAVTKRELEADDGEACELPIAAGGGGGHGSSSTASVLRRAQQLPIELSTIFLAFSPIFEGIFLFFFGLTSLEFWTAAPRATKGRLRLMGFSLLTFQKVEAHVLTADSSAQIVTRAGGFLGRRRRWRYRRRRAPARATRWIHLPGEHEQGRLGEGDPPQPQAAMTWR